MRDFTLKAYSAYIQAIKRSDARIMRIDAYLRSETKPESFCLIRHDVDRKPNNALRMAKLEYRLGVCASYYFRDRNNTFKPDIMMAISDMGHEVGYHYECLSDAKWNMKKAFKSFEVNLNKFRKFVPINTISMHARFDNRDMWKNPAERNLLLRKYNLLGELYHDIDYSDIAYINDTGRNWSSTRANLRDRTPSKIKADFKNRRELYKYLTSRPNPRILFQIHPERWEDRVALWTVQLIIDSAINVLKVAIK